MWFWIKVILGYTVAGLIFPYSWLREQPHALRMAWHDSVGSAHEHVKRYRAAQARSSMEGEADA